MASASKDGTGTLDGTLDGSAPPARAEAHTSDAMARATCTCQPSHHATFTSQPTPAAHATYTSQASATAGRCDGASVSAAALPDGWKVTLALAHTLPYTLALTLTVAALPDGWRATTLRRRSHTLRPRPPEPGRAPQPSAQATLAADGRTYYYHAATKQTQWAPPVDAAPAPGGGAGALPAGWKEATAPDGRVYYYAPGAAKTQWVRPTQPAPAAEPTPSATLGAAGAGSVWAAHPSYPYPTPAAPGVWAGAPGAAAAPNSMAGGGAAAEWGMAAHPSHAEWPGVDARTAAATQLVAEGLEEGGAEGGGHQDGHVLGTAAPQSRQEMQEMGLPSSFGFVHR